MLLILKYPLKSRMIESQNFLLKGPTYETNAEANKTSPVIWPRVCPSYSILVAHLSLSEPSAFTSLFALSNLAAHLFASASAAFFSSIAC